MDSRCDSIWISVYLLTAFSSKRSTVEIHRFIARQSAYTYLQLDKHQITARLIYYIYIYIFCFLIKVKGRKGEPFKTLLYNEREETFNKCCPNEVQENCIAPYRASACRLLRSITEKLPLWVLLQGWWRLAGRGNSMRGNNTVLSPTHDHMGIITCSCVPLPKAVPFVWVQGRWGRLPLMGLLF